MNLSELHRTLTRLKDAFAGHKVFCNDKPVIVQTVVNQEIPRWRFSDAKEAGREAVVVPGPLYKIAPVHRDPMYLTPAEFFIAANLAGSTTFQQINDAVLVQLDLLFGKVLKAAEPATDQAQVSPIFAGMPLTPSPVLAECFYLTYRQSPGNVKYLHKLDDGRVFAKFSLTLGPADMIYRPTIDPDWTMNLGPG